MGNFTIYGIKKNLQLGKHVFKQGYQPPYIVNNQRPAGFMNA